LPLKPLTLTVARPDNPQQANQDPGGHSIEQSTQRPIEVIKIAIVANEFGYRKMFALSRDAGSLLEPRFFLEIGSN
jgi:hypothetical protein